MAERVQFDPEGVRSGTRSIGSAHDGARSSGEALATVLMRLAPALGNDKYAQKALEEQKLRQFSENICTAGGEELPGAMGSAHDAMSAAIEAFDAAEDASSRNLS